MGNTTTKKLTPAQAELLAELKRDSLYCYPTHSPLRPHRMRSLKLLIHAKLVAVRQEDFRGEMIQGMYRNQTAVYSITSLGLEFLGARV